MKYLIVIALIIFAAYNVKAELSEDKIQEIYKNCQANNNVKNEELASGNESKNFPCMISCILMESGVMDSKLKINKPVAKKYLSLTLSSAIDVTNVIDNCSELNVSSDSCAAASEYYSCMQNLIAKKD